LKCGQHLGTQVWQLPQVYAGVLGVKRSGVKDGALLMWSLRLLDLVGAIDKPALPPCVTSRPFDAEGLSTPAGAAC